MIVGFMAWQELKMTVITSNLPVLLFVLMLPYAVYFIERYRERRTNFPMEDAALSTFESARVIWIPCLFSATTTMAGFASLMTSGINPVRTFGKMMSIGMGVGLCLVFLFIPSLSKPLPGMKVSDAGVKKESRSLVRFFERISLGRPLYVVLFSILLLGMSVLGAIRLNAETKFTDYFQRESEVYQGLEFIDQQMGGTTSLEILLRSDQKDYFRTEEGMEAIGAVETYFDTVPETGNVRSIKSLRDEMRKSFKKEWFPKQKDKALVGLIGNVAPGLIREFANEDYTLTRIFIRMKETSPTLHRNNILRGLRNHLEEQAILKKSTVNVTGVFLLYANMLNSLIESQKETFIWVLGAIYLMLVILFRGPILAFIVLLPQVLPAVVVLGVMGWTGIPLDLVTVMIASIAMGVGIDAAIQYTIRFREELGVDGDPRAALRRSHATIGRAIWIATSVIVAGFCVLMLSKFRPSLWFGLFTAVAMLMSQFAALTTLPSLFLLTGYPKVRNRT
jgi:predicted RND superfamily exporter protein